MKKYEIKDLFFTQKEIAEYLGITTRTLRRYIKINVFPKPLYKNTNISVYSIFQLKDFKASYILRGVSTKEDINLHPDSKID